MGQARRRVRPAVSAVPAVGSVVGVTMRSGGDPDAYWRRPAGSPADAQPPVAPSPGPEPAPYAGPPPTEPPPPGWRTPQVVRPAPPRNLPQQNLAEVDEAERSARTLTYGVGMIAGAVVLILICLLCSRALF
jgi:hypothetical protein